MINPSWLLLLWGIFTMVVVVFLVFGGQEADAINPIKGYVSEAKAKAQPVKVIAEVIEEVKNFVLPPQPQASSEVTKIIGIQLSRTCLQQEKHNLTSKCPTYQDLMQFDNTIKYVSGDITYHDGYWHREQPNFKKHCNYYTPNYILLIVVDPDGCWFKERGIKTITIQSINPNDFVYKLTADRDLVTQMRDLNRERDEDFENKDDAEKAIDRLEDSIDSQELRITQLEDDIEENERDRTKSTLSTRNLKFQLRFANDRLADLEIDLRAEEIKFAKYVKELNATRVDLRTLSTEHGSRLMIDGVSSMGVGRYIEECRFAQVGYDMDLITDTLNYLINNCEFSEYKSVQSTTVEQTPINISDFTWYKYQKWLKESLVRCLEKC